MFSPPRSPTETRLAAPHGSLRRVSRPDAVLGDRPMLPNPAAACNSSRSSTKAHAEAGHVQPSPDGMCMSSRSNVQPATQPMVQSAHSGPSGTKGVCSPASPVASAVLPGVLGHLPALHLSPFLPPSSTNVAHSVANRKKSGKTAEIIALGRIPDPANSGARFSSRLHAQPDADDTGCSSSTSSCSASRHSNIYRFVFQFIKFRVIFF